MNQPERHENFDTDAIRRKISEVRTRSASERNPQDAPVELNSRARLIARQFHIETYSPTMLIGLLRLSEALAVTGFGLGTMIWLTGLDLNALTGAGLLAGLVGLLTILFVQIADGYQITALRSAARTLPRIMLAFAAAFCLVLMGMVMIGAPTDVPQSWFISFALSGAGLFLIERTFIAFAIRRWSRNGTMERRAVIVGGGEPAKQLIRNMEAQADNDIRICGIFDDRDARRSPDIIAGYPKLGTVAELVEFARLARVDMLIISLPLTAEQRILELLRKVWVLPVDIRLAAHANNLKFRPRSYSHVGKVPMLALFDKPIADWDAVAKRIFDIFFSLVALALLWPVFLGAALAVKLTSPGPIIFKQVRHGFNNEEIRVFKFRSMYTNMSDPTARQAVTKGDPRVTPVGRFIRKTSIDELPQIFNVLRGDLSLVGPRPHAVLAQTADRVYADVVEGYFARHRVKPGVTGWAQINGWRGEIDSDDKIKYRTAFDLYYIENWSLWFDLKILFLTPIRLMNTENAY
ncbi:undecaprenyl-phosphate glucose phosphotransferase [Rhizobium sp. RU20A]|uniref:undecaprenyl-phosphate glucose phosphotransferase n=1 Tax=Rhizobium sp. RU20A TaxID=1907412 RepID=UPI00122CE303|nr:undecaprenyl-phosphate glucose phosphotransferase [Rhizobium sp. RU20A]